MKFRSLFSVAFISALILMPVGARAEEAGQGEAVPGLEEQIHAARQEMGRIDARMSALQQEEQTLMTEAREAHQGRFDVRQQLMEGDEEIQAMVQRIEAVQRELHGLQEALAKRMAEQPDYAAEHDRQADAIRRAGALQRESMVLAEDRVRVQLELEALERRQAELAEDVAPANEDGDATLSAEDPDQL